MSIVDKETENYESGVETVNDLASQLSEWIKCKITG